MKRALTAVALAGTLVVASPGAVWAADRPFDDFKFRRLQTVMYMQVIAVLGLVEEQNAPHECVEQVPVKIQRRAKGRWVTKKSLTTDEDGKVKGRMRRRNGRYRALAPATMTDAGFECFKSTSNAVTVNFQ